MDGAPERNPLNSEDSGTPEEYVARTQFASDPQGVWPTPEPPAPGNGTTWSQGPVYLPPVPLAPIPREPRIPHLGHVVLFGLLAFFGALCAGGLTALALHQHWFGVFTVNQAKLDIHYTLGSEAILYLITFGACLLIFPLVWRRSFMDGLHWNGAAALQRYRVLFAAALICFLLALLSELVMPGPSNAPIDKMFRVPGAAWFLFAFGITFAPFFEEMMFRGFLLPAFCTACDWIAEKFQHREPPPSYSDGHPRWSFGAMVFGSVLASFPFALMHVPQQGYSLGPFLLLLVVSLVLCWARLSTRSLAASVTVHATYNLMIFLLTMITTEGFRNLHKM
ncbi:MAG TPA: CPBP family intramembrane glutamic endopeptidase [Terracidiphilus sp.]|nr:CPBP family intramembrane glutamic endopeptidase [Terracidiphilus sp.]